MNYYIDCEFNGFGGELISMALIAGNGKNIYLINLDRTGMPEKWVRENVIPILYDCPAKPIECSLNLWPNMIFDFIKETYDGSIHIIADWPDDLKYFCQTIITGPGKMIGIPAMTMEMARVESYPTKLQGAVHHNAWWDAMALKDKLK